jgi:hypothetical protein
MNNDKNISTKNYLYSLGKMYLNDSFKAGTLQKMRIGLNLIEKAASLGHEKAERFLSTYKASF